MTAKKMTRFLRRLSAGFVVCVVAFYVIQALVAGFSVTESAALESQTSLQELERFHQAMQLRFNLPNATEPLFVVAHSPSGPVMVGDRILNNFVIVRATVAPNQTVDWFVPVMFPFGYRSISVKPYEQEDGAIQVQSRVKEQDHSELSVVGDPAVVLPPLWFRDKVAVKNVGVTEVEIVLWDERVNESLYRTQSERHNALVDYQSYYHVGWRGL